MNKSSSFVFLTWRKIIRTLFNWLAFYSALEYLKTSASVLDFSTFLCLCDTNCVFSALSKKTAKCFLTARRVMDFWVRYDKTIYEQNL